MGRPPTLLGPTGRCRRHLDGPRTRACPREEDITAAPPSRLDCPGPVLPRPEGTPQASAEPLEEEFVADLQQLWASLPEHDKTEFEGHFSRMVLRLFHGLSIEGGQL
jgi:hypothetical protein